MSAASTGARELEAVLRESRQGFIEAFSGLCNNLALHAAGDAGAPSAEDVSDLVHRLAGLGGTVGFPRVSAEASALELALTASGTNADRLREGVAALQSAFAKDLREPAATGMAPAQQGAAMTVLLVEDDRVQRAVICAQLRHAGHSPIEVSCGEDAIAAARSARPDAILLDVELPGVNGYAVCRMLKSDAELADIPVAFLSARANVDDRLTGLSHGADDFFTKPIDPRELSLRLQLLNKRGQRGELPHRGVLTYEAFCVEARRALRHTRTALALIRTPPDRAVDVAAFTRDE
ncbi:MAG: response regulator, partial [Planctomycetota bacterium]|nr:response regulator [Planctomycetota bacterium]